MRAKHHHRRPGHSARAGHLLLVLLFGGIHHAAGAATENTDAAPTDHKGAKITFGGFIAAETVSRSRSEMSDVSSATANIPFQNKPNYNFSEFHGSARQSRLSILAQRDHNERTQLGAYYEIDFMGASSTSNLQQSNSYIPRMRHLYATVDLTETGVHALAGQTWSLVTMNTRGIIPRDEWTPLRIDSAYVPGFTWVRQDQIRLVKDWDGRYWAGISLENPQTTYGTNGTIPPNLYTAVPASNLNSGTAISISNRPDLVIKFAVDPGFGHFEIFDLNRSYEWTSVTGTGTKTATSNAIGGSALIPVVPNTVDLNVSMLSGKGIGRYGSAQLPDATFVANGDVAALRERQFLTGLTFHPDKTLDIYLYYGEERAKQLFSSVGGVAYGYGNPAISNAGCITPGGTCTASIEKVSQVTLGFWWKIFQGGDGKMQFGVQYSRVYVATFADSTGLAPKTSNTMVFTSLRYYPF